MHDQLRALLLSVAAATGCGAVDGLNGEDCAYTHVEDVSLAPDAECQWLQAFSPYAFRALPGEPGLRDASPICGVVNAVELRQDGVTVVELTRRDDIKGGASLLAHAAGDAYSVEPCD